MPYKLYSPHSPGEHEVLQWNCRDFETEAEITSGRTIVAEFDKLKENVPLKVVEAGCGLGGWVKYFKNQGQDVVGIEYVESVVQRVREADPGLPVQTGDITALAFPDNFFDVYVSLGVLEHFEEGPDLPLREAHRVVKPQGLVFIAIPLPR